MCVGGSLLDHLNTGLYLLQAEMVCFFPIGVYIFYSSVLFLYLGLRSILKESRVSRHFASLLILEEMLPEFPHLAPCSHVKLFIMSKHVPSLLSFFSHFILKGMLNVVKDLSPIHRDDHATPTLKSILDYIDYA